MSIKQRLYPEKGQINALIQHCGQTRFVYNWGLEQRRKVAEQKKNGADISWLTYITQAKQLTRLRKEIDWLGSGSSAIQQDSLRALDTAFTNFFTQGRGYPNFKKRNAKQSFHLRRVVVKKYNRRNAAVYVPKLGYIRFRLSRPFSEIVKATSAQITFVNNRWFVSFTTPPPEKKRGGSGIVGIDRGIAITAMTSDREAFHIPVARKHDDKRYKALQRQLQRTDKESNRRKRILGKMASCRRKASNRKKEFVEQTTTYLSATYERAILEDVKISNMAKRIKPKQDETGKYLPNGQSAKTGLNRSLYSSCWYMFEVRLSDKMDVTKINPAYTSQRCSMCGHVSKENRENQAVFSCKSCGYTDNADFNAAVNIKNAYKQDKSSTPRMDYALCINDGQKSVKRPMLTSSSA